VGVFERLSIPYIGSRTAPLEGHVLMQCAAMRSNERSHERRQVATFWCQIGVLYGAIKSCGLGEGTTKCVCLEVGAVVCRPVSILDRLYCLRQEPSLFGPSGSRIKLPMRPTKQETACVCGIFGLRGCIVYTLAGEADWHPVEHLSSS
jgi:hypothetical protein